MKARNFISASFFVPCPLQIGVVQPPDSFAMRWTHTPPYACDKWKLPMLAFILSPSRVYGVAGESVKVLIWLTRYSNVLMLVLIMYFLSFVCLFVCLFVMLGGKSCNIGRNKRPKHHAVILSILLARCRKLPFHALWGTMLACIFPYNI